MTDELTNWRKEIDKLDKELIAIVAKRMELVRQIGKYKKLHKLPPLDKKRWQEVLQSRIAQAEFLKIPRKLIENMYTIIHDEALKIEKGAV